MQNRAAVFVSNSGDQKNDSNFQIVNQTNVYCCDMMDLHSLCLHIWTRKASCRQKKDGNGSLFSYIETYQMMNSLQIDSLNSPCVHSLSKLTVFHQDKYHLYQLCFKQKNINFHILIKILLYLYSTNKQYA